MKTSTPKLRTLIESHYNAKTIPDTASELLNDLAGMNQYVQRVGEAFNDVNDSRKLMKAYNDLYAMLKKAEETL